MLFVSTRVRDASVPLESLMSERIPLRSMRDAALTALALALCACAEAGTAGVETPGSSEDQAAPAAAALGGTGAGLEARYFDNVDHTNLVGTRTDARLDLRFDGDTLALDASRTVQAESFSAEWTGLLEAPTTDTYALHATGHDYVELWLATRWEAAELAAACSNDDGCAWDQRCEDSVCAEPIYTQHISRWNGTGSAEVALEAGARYPVQLRFRAYDRAAQVTVEWASSTLARQVIPTSQLYAPTPDLEAGTGLAAHYIPHRLTSPPDAAFDPRASRAAFQRVDAELNFDWGLGSPVSEIGFPSDNFMVLWDGQIAPRYSEEYTFGATSDDGLALYVDGELVIDAWSGGAANAEGTIALEAGQRYDILFAIWDGEGSAEASLRWSSASQEDELVPTSQLFPAETLSSLTTLHATGMRAARSAPTLSTSPGGSVGVEPVRLADGAGDALAAQRERDPLADAPSTRSLSVTPEEQIAAGECRSVISIEEFDDGDLPDSLEEQDGLQLVSTTTTASDLWIANSDEWTLSRIDTETGELLGTYPAGRDASRTAVDLDYNVWVANRALSRFSYWSGWINYTGSVSKLLAYNADGTPCECCTTTNFLGECVYDPNDICSECVGYTINFGTRSIPRGLAIGADNSTWVGLWGYGQLVQMRNCSRDPDTGDLDYECLFPVCEPGDTLCIDRAIDLGGDCSTVPSASCQADFIMRIVDLEIAPYGLAIDQSGKIWIASGPYDGASLECYDTVTGESCGVYQQRDQFDEAECTNPYGLAVDADGNVWWGNWTCDGLGHMNRELWEASVAANTSAGGVVDWTAVEGDVSRNAITTFNSAGAIETRGVAVDGSGNVWLAASNTDRILQFDPTAPAQPGNCNTSGTFCPPGDFVGSYATCQNPIGVGISDEGYAWGVCRYSDQARAYNADGDLMATAQTGVGPYSYSDMTGFQLRNFTAPQGQWSQVFRCSDDAVTTDADGNCVFDFVSWESLVPSGSNLMVRVRVGDDTDGDDVVEWGPWSEEFEVSPSSLGAEAYQGEFVEVEITLFASPSGDSPVVTATQLWECPLLLPPVNLDVDERFIVDAASNDYGISWSFVDDSWPELYWELLDENNVVQCQVVSTTSQEIGDTYIGQAGPTPACREEGRLSNTPLTRAARTVNSFQGTELRSELGPALTRYTLVNNPTEVNRDLRVMSRTENAITVNWCKPQQNWAAGLTGAQVVRSTTPSFNPADEGYAVLASFPASDAAAMSERGYANPDAFCGNFEDTGLDPGTVYYYELRFQNGDGISSDPLVVSLETYGRPCCDEVGSCEGVCGGAVTSGDGSPTDISCTLPPTYEDPELTCDGLDNDCDGEADEGLLNACGSCGPTPPEACDGFDNDCDGTADNNPVDGFFYYPDADEDTWGDDAGAQLLCARPTGWVNRGGDCRDLDPDINPDAEEICDGLDNNCNGEIDETGDATTYYADSDTDGFGDPDETTLACIAPEGYVSDATDCDDTRDFIYPGAPEVCDGFDNNCDDTIDEGFALYDVTIDEVSDVATVGVDACDNDYTGPECESAAAVVIRVSNTGSVALSAAARVRFRLELPYADTLYDWDALPADVPAAGEETFTYCFAHGVAATPSTAMQIYVDLDVDAAAGCGTDEDMIEGDGLLISTGEICDGFDNDCDGETDESPEACGVTQICVENETGEGDPYLCVSALVAEPTCVDAACPGGTYCDPSGACVLACVDDIDCGASAECHVGACVSVAAIAEEAAATDAFAATPSGPTLIDEPKTGCATAPRGGGAAWGLLLLGLALQRRRRRSRF